jgi:sugar lactone lactonase YvrE
MSSLRAILLFSALSTPALAAPVTVIESYNAALGQLPEGVAVSPHGDIFVGLAGTGQIRQLDRKTYAGEVLTSLPIGGGFLLGLAFEGDDLYAVVASFDAATCGVWAVEEDGSASRVVAFGANEFPNDLTFDADGNLFITESISGSVYRVEAGSTSRSLFVQDALLVGDINQSPVPFPIGVNGITYDDDTQSVLVVNSQVPALIEIDDLDGEAGALSVIAAGEHLRGGDGLSLDENGDVILVSNHNSTVSRIDRDNGNATVLADADDGLVFPSTAAFGQHGTDKRSLFIANFGFGAGPSAPVGLLKLKMSTKGEKEPAGK